MSQWQIRERSRARMFIADGDSAVTDIATGGTYVKVAGTTTAGNLVDFTHTNGRLTYQGPKRWFNVLAVTTVIDGLAGNTAHLRIAKNGTAIAASEQQRKIVQAGDIGNMSCEVDVELTSDDYVELYVTTNVGQDDEDFTAVNMGFVVW